jgi:ABC-type uncharacterized transport system substrate-binding protein
MRFRQFVALTAMLLLPVVSAFAHPHVFITSHVAVDMKSSIVNRISIDWTFDELFSQMVVADYDRGKKGYFTESEAAALKKGAFDNLRNYHYFLALFVDNKPKPLPPIADFKPSMHGGRLVYSFALPLDVPIPAAGRELRLTIYDDTYYVAFDKLQASDVGIEGDSTATSYVSIVKTKVKAEWPGQFMPDQILIRFGKG